MIINIKGTSGTGKSTIVREVVRRYHHKVDHFREGRKQPIYTVHYPDDEHRDEPSGLVPLVTLGHYNTPCGGCDTISKQEDIFRIVREQQRAGRDVLYEGLLVSGEVANTARLHLDGMPLEVIALDVPVEVCIASVNERRWAKSPDKPPVKPDNTIAKHRGVQLAMKRLGADGVSCTWASRDGALSLVLRLLGWSSQNDGRMVQAEPSIQQLPR